MSTVTTLPERSEVPIEDTWDLSTLYESDDAWHKGLKEFDEKIEGYHEFQGTLGQGAEQLAACLQFDSEMDRVIERLGNYAFLKTAEDQSNSDYQAMAGRLRNAGMKASEAASYIRPEILSISEEDINRFLEHEALQPYRLMVERLLRYKPHTLGEKEEQLLAMQGEMAGATSKIFRQLTDADLKFGTLVDESGTESELTQSTFSKFLLSPDRDVRKKAFHQFYEQFQGHENTLAATLAGSIQTDVYYARARGYSSALDQALYADDVPMSVYDNLIATVREHLPTVHQYFDLRRRKMNLDSIHHYDTYVPILSEIKSHYDWDEAVDAVVDALQPLGETYCAAMRDGLRGRWCDRYPNKGKQSGAFSYGTYDGQPYIMMNYKPEVLNDVFTLAHEAGHSMHTYFSAGNQPFEYYNYVIFVAEVASTFNEQLLTRHLLAETDDSQKRAYLINNEIDSIRSTIVRQTMFAEFEKITHEMAETGEPLTVDSFKSTYRQLLEDYFGRDFVLDDELSLECMRIPHFYRAFYVYKYATGLSAAIALSQRVVDGGQSELDDYLGFLKAGCSKFPLELLRDAGVDMEKPEPIETAMKRFGALVRELDELI